MADQSTFGKKVIDTELSETAQAEADQQVADYSVGPEQLQHIETYGTQAEQADRLRNDAGVEYVEAGDQSFDSFTAEQKLIMAETNKQIEVAKDVLNLEIESRDAAPEIFEYPDVEIAWSDSLPAILASHAKDVVIDAPVSATIDFVAEFALALTDLARFVLPLDTLYYGFRQQIEDGSFSIDSFETGMGVAERNAEAGRELIRGIADDLSPEIDNPVAQIEREMIKFIEGFIPASRAVQVLNAVQKGVKLSRVTQSIHAAEAAAITSSVIYDPEQPNIANVIQMSAAPGGFPDISNGIAEFLSTVPGDPQSYNRLKNALSEFIIGPVADAFISALRVAKNGAWQQHLNRRYANEVTEAGEVHIDPVADEVAVAVERAKVDKELRDLGPEGEVRADELKATEGKLEDSGPARAEARPDDAPVVERKPLSNDSIRQDFQDAVSPDLRQRLIELVNSGDYIQGDMGWFNRNNFDLGSIETREELLAVFDAIESIMHEAAVKNGTIKVQTWKQTQEYGKAVGFSAEQVHQLHSDLTRNHGLSARLHATHQTMIANGQRMLTLMEIARKTGDPTDVIAANRAIELQAAIMMEAKGSTAEVARSLNGMKIHKDAAAQSFADLDSAAREFGVRSKIIDDLLGKDIRTLSDINKAAEKMTKATVWEMIAEVAINGMLFNPETHIVNMSSNLAMMVITPWERFMAATIGKGRQSLGVGTADRYLVRAVGKSLKAQIMGMDQTWAMTLKAFKESAPQSDTRQKIQIAARPRLSAYSLGLDGNKGLGLVIDKVVAPAVRFSTRMLTTEDELFKATYVRGELAAVAYEQSIKHADDAGLTGAAHMEYALKREKFLLENPTVKMQRDAIDVARRGTFQENAETKGGPIIERLINIHPASKLVLAPFYRTPTNVLRQTFIDRVPLLNLIVKKNRAAIRAGGREGDMVIARTVTGTLALWGGYSLVTNWSGEDRYFEVIGKRPYDTTGRFDNVKDYSFRLGDTWYRFNRFDPVGSWLAFAADSKAIFDSRYDPADPDADKHVEDYLFAATGALARNALDKVWLKSLANIVSTIERLDGQSPAQAMITTERFFADQLIKIVPFSAGLRAMTAQTDPLVREAWTVVDRVMAIIPGASDGLAPMRDELGRVIPNLQGGNYLINPFAAGPESKDPMDQELARLDFTWARLNKSIESGHIVLNAVQYSRFKFLIGQVEPFPGIPSLEGAIRNLFERGTYNNMTDMMRIREIEGYRTAYKQTAELVLKQEFPELQRRSRDILIIESEEMAGRRLGWLREILKDKDNPLHVADDK